MQKQCELQTNFEKLKTALINGKLIQSKVIYKIYKVKLLFKTKIENRMQQLRGICMKKTLKSFLNNGLHALLFSCLICISPAKALESAVSQMEALSQSAW